MAERHWRGTPTSDDLQVAGNWLEDSVPVDGDNIYFDGFASQPPGTNLGGFTTYAVSTLTLTANASATNVYRIDVAGSAMKGYIFTDPLGSLDGDVLVGATASDSLDNLIAAINLAAGAGTTYASATTAPNINDARMVDAAAGAGDTMDLTSRFRGPDGTDAGTVNISGLTGSVTQFSADGANLASLRFGNIIIDPTCPYDVGRSGDPFVASYNKLIHAGQGRLYHEVGSGKCTETIIRTPKKFKAGQTASLANNITYDVLTGTHGNYYHYITCARGHLVCGRFGTSYNRTEVLTTRRSSRFDALVEIHTDFAVAEVIAHSGVTIVRGGQVISFPVRVGEGDVIMANRTTSASSFHMLGGGRIIYNSNATLPILFAVKGEVDFMRTGGFKPITTAYRFRDGRLRRIPDLHPITNDIDLRGGN